MPMRGGISRLQKERERGQVLVLVALLLPLFLAIGSIVIDVGNWYVLKRHLQTQVDAAALAGGPAFTGCFQNPLAARDAIAQQALAYAGDPTRDPSAHNPLMQDTADVHAVLNSTTFWTQGDLPDGHRLDVRDALRHEVPRRQGDGRRGATPLEVDPVLPGPQDSGSSRGHRDPELERNEAPRRARARPRGGSVLVVDEDGDPDLLGTIRGRSHLDPQSIPPTGLEDMSVWSRDFIAPVNLSGNTDFGVIIVANRSTTPIPPNQSLSQICSPASGQVECYGGGTSDSGISFIHAYSTTGYWQRDQPDRPWGHARRRLHGRPLDAVLQLGRRLPGHDHCRRSTSAPGALIPVPDASRRRRVRGGLGAACGVGQLTLGGRGSGQARSTPAADGANQVDLSWSTDTSRRLRRTNGTETTAASTRSRSHTWRTPLRARSSTSRSNGGRSRASRTRSPSPAGEPQGDGGAHPAAARAPG